MRKFVTGLKVFAFLAFATLCHYVLPQHDIARITSTEVIRMDFSGINRIFFAQADSGNNDLSTRDIRLINTVKRKSWLFGFIPREGEKVMVYRNEDTGWIWPPYFKFDSSDLQAQAASLISTPGHEQWVVITHYGWRNRFFTIYPNAIAIRPVDGPDVYPIPWVSIFFFLFVGVAWLTIRGMWRQFRERSVDPLLQDIDEATDAAADRAQGAWARWFGRRK